MCVSYMLWLVTYQESINHTFMFRAWGSLVFKALRF